MVVRIRLKRMGKKKQPFYRIVVAESRNPRDGQTIEDVGIYNPTRNPVVLEVKQERIKYWLSVGAKPSDTAQRLFSDLKLMEKAEKKSQSQGIPKKERPKKEEK